MIDIEARRRADEQMERLKDILDANNIDWEVRGEGTPVVEFRNATGMCRMFPSQTTDGKLVVLYSGKGIVDTAEEAARMCGVSA